MFKPYLNLNRPTNMLKSNIGKLAFYGVLIFCTINNAFADKQDFEKPITVDSKTQFVDGKSKTSIFKGDVHITQGSLKIDADEVEVNASNGEGKEVFIARGTPAVYSQTMDDGSDIRAVANEIKYQVTNRTLTLTGSAELHQNSSMVQGNSITFNLDKQQLEAKGQGDGKGRVITVFRPESASTEGEDKQ